MKTVILAAGFGSRLWPLSTSDKPKQFQKLINGESLLKYTYDLMGRVTPKDELYVLTLRGLEHHVFEQLPGIGKENVLLVPERRNTLPHTLWAIKAVGNENPDEPILFKSSDQYMDDPDTFLASLKLCIANIERRQPLSDLTLMCMESGYSPNMGYALTDKEGRITKFVEKPSESDFHSLSQQGTPYRSPFIYASSKNVMLKILREIDSPLAKQSMHFLTCNDSDSESVFLHFPVVDLSKGLFQSAIGMRAELLTCEFIDIGRFPTLYAISDKDSDGNAVQGNVVLGEGCQGNFVINQLEDPLVLNQSSHMVVIQTDAGSLVSPLDKADPVGEIYKTKIHPNEP